MVVLFCFMLRFKALRLSFSPPVATKDSLNFWALEPGLEPFGLLELGLGESTCKSKIEEEGALVKVKLFGLGEGEEEASPNTGSFGCWEVDIFLNINKFEI